MTIITISGTPGSGKSTVSELLEEKLNIQYVYSGIVFRNLAKKYEMSLDEFSKYCEANEDIDKKLDEEQVKILKKGNVILEGRLAGWLAYQNNISAYKIMIDADINIRAERVVNREQGDVEFRKQEIIQREESENKRYKEFYNIDLKDTSIYDLVIDSSNKTPEEIVDEILLKINN
jgi:predicted cytidylate kinase